MREKEDLREVEKNFRSPKRILQSAMEVIDFHGLQDKRYVNHLEKRL